MEDESNANSAVVGQVYDVFMSFRGPDTRVEFADFLYNIMRDAGIKVYRDDDELSPGQEIKTILQAIDNSRICMPIFSKNFASSSWCLREVAKMVDLKKEIIPVFYHVTPDDVKLKTTLYKDQVKKLEVEDNHDQILLWEASLREAAKSKGRELKDQGAYGFVNDLVKELLIKLKIKHQNVPEYLVGIDFQLEAAMKLLNVGSGGVRMIRIYGTGGIGKTTLAKSIFNKIMGSFDCHCFLDDIAGDSKSTCQDLQKQLLVNLDPKLKNLVGSVDPISIMQKNFQNQKVLIVLDNVDQKQQIEYLVGNGSWFGMGSRIIITTRDDSVLVVEDEDEAPESSSRSQSREVCVLEMKALNPEQSLQLFCWHVFKKDYPKPEYEELANQVVRTIGGLPLALEIIGLLLRGKCKNFWKDKVAQLKQIVDPGVKGKLRVSFDALEITEQQIFLDIACFFIMYEVSRPTYMWEACNLFPTAGLSVLISRSLIKIQGERFWMHDQLRILGREIARDRSFKGSECYRFYEQTEAMNMLMYKKGKDNVVGLQLDKPCDTLTAGYFADLLSLRYLLVSRASFTSGFQHPLPSLKWLGFHSCPANFDMSCLSSSDLVILDLSHSSIDGNWQGWSQMQSRYLKVLDLSYCVCLEVTPSFSKMVCLSFLLLDNCVFLIKLSEDLDSLQNLKWLYLPNCVRLSRLPESLGKLKSLVRLSLTNTAIRTLPNSIGELKELEHLFLRRCKIVRLPETFGGLESLVELNLSHSDIEELPNSIGRLKKLEELSLHSCSKIKRLPESLGDLESLVLLNLSCSSVMELPPSIGRLKKLERLEMQESKMDTLPPEIEELPSLRILNLHEASNIRTLPELPHSLTELSVFSHALVEVPNLSSLSNLRDLKLVDGSEWYIKTRTIESLRLKGIGNLPMLENLDLIMSNITTLPQDLGALSRLRSLILGCPSFKCIPQLPTSLQLLRLRSGLSKLKWFNLSYLSDLKILSISGFCFTAFSELQLPESLESLALKKCQSQSTSDGIPPLKNLLHLELLRCKELSEITGLEGLDSLESLDIECCETLQHVGNLLEMKKRVEVTIFSCPMLNLGAYKFTVAHFSKFFQREMVHDEKVIWELIKRDDVQLSDYQIWWEGSSVEETTSEQEILNDDETSDIASDVVVHDLGLLLSSPGRDFLIRNNGQRVQIDSIIKRDREYRVVLLFSASWCVSSHLFIYVMKRIYTDEYQTVFIFVSLDEDNESFRSHFSLMPWFAIPFFDSDKRSGLVELFKVTDIPQLVHIDEQGRISSMRLSELTGVPLGEVSYPCPLESLNLLKAQRDAALRNQSLTSLLVHGLHNCVLSPEGNQIPASTLEGKIVGLYFSYPFVTACSVKFHKRLVGVYEELKKNEENFEIVSLRPFDEAANLFIGNLENFLMLPMNFNRFSELIHRFEIKNIPALVIIGSNGRTLNRDAADAINEHGVAAYPFSMEKLADFGWEVIGQNEAVWQKHSLRSALDLHASLEFVISPDGIRLPISALEGKVVGIYFAHPSLSCIEFTLDLLGVYEKLNAGSEMEKFQVVLVYLQRDASLYNQNIFSQSFGTLPWLLSESSIAISQELASYFKVFALPSLVIIGKDGKVINFSAVDVIREYGAKAYPFTPEKIKQMANVKEVSRNIRDASSLWPKKLLVNLHDHQLVATIKKRMYICNLCSQTGYVWSYCCEECDFDLHCECGLKEQVGTAPSWSRLIHNLKQWCCLPFLSIC